MEEQQDLHNRSTPNVIVLSGSKKQMGRAYGAALSDNLRSIYDILLKYYVEEKKVSMSNIVNKAQLFYDKYPYSFQQFIQGVAKGANITLEQAIILNAMETLNSLVKPKNSDVSACSFISIPPDQSTSKAMLIGRNYDFLPPFDQCAQYLTVTVIKETDHVPTAFIGFAGQIYCPTCVNSNGLFVELNNGMPSGGYYTEHSRETLLINLLESLQNSANMAQLDRQLSALNSDYSLVINTANATHVKSFEYSSTKGMKASNFTNKEIVVSTNFFTNENWGLSTPSDNECWLGVTRRDNLLQLTNNRTTLSVNDLQFILDLHIENGGAKWDYTIYQIIFDTSSLDLLIKTPKISHEWHRIELSKEFEESFQEACVGIHCAMADEL